MAYNTKLAKVSNCNNIMMMKQEKPQEIQNEGIEIEEAIPTTLDGFFIKKNTEI
jgi:hypothetical protein